MLKWFRDRQATLATDIHSHLIPGVDDGCQSMEESIQAIQGLQKLGFQRAVTTPHIYGDLYPNTENNLKKIHTAVCEHLSVRDIPFELMLGAEYFVDEHFLKKINDHQELLSFGDRYVLIETSFGSRPMIWDEAIFELQVKGYRPLIAHPERYAYVYEDPQILHEWKSRGLLLQLSIPSLIGAYGKGVMEMAKYMISNDLVDSLGTDLHRPEELKRLEKARKSRYFGKTLRKSLINNRL